tara:strand:- start:45 stop:338 length:294 start_codon:yes stop_codon:yes gene_type:complete
MAITITVNINDLDEKALKDSLPDVDDWVQKAVEGKINNCKKRMHREWTAILTEDETFTDPIASNMEDFVNQVVALPTYKNAKTRYDEAEAKLQEGQG